MLSLKSSDTYNLIHVLITQMKCKITKCKIEALPLAVSECVAC